MSEKKKEKEKPQILELQTDGKEKGNKYIK